MFDARAAQNELTRIGLLDPPADGKFGPLSRWTLGEALFPGKGAFMGDLEESLNERLLAVKPLPLALADNSEHLASRLVRTMLDAGHFVGRHPDFRTILYIEGGNLDGTPNGNKPNQFNDARYVLRVGLDYRPMIMGAWAATTEPSRFWTQQPMNPKGAARIKFGQYKAWVVGTHHAGSASAHEALVQADDLTVCRDLNKDFKRDGDKEDTGDSFGVNQHWGYDLPHDDLGRSSAGCLVGMSKNGHREFMAIIKGDRRYLTNHGYKFMTSILPVSAIPAGRL